MATESTNRRESLWWINRNFSRFSFLTYVTLRGCFYCAFRWHVKQISCLPLAIKKRRKNLISRPMRCTKFVSHDIQWSHKFQYKQALKVYFQFFFYALTLQIKSEKIFTKYQHTASFPMKIISAFFFPLIYYEGSLNLFHLTVQVFLCSINL